LGHGQNILLETANIKLGLVRNVHLTSVGIIQGRDYVEETQTQRGDNNIKVDFEEIWCEEY